MQIPLVESRLALSYSSWFSDLGFAFFVRWLQVSALFDFMEVWHEKICMDSINADACLYILFFCV